MEELLQILLNNPWLILLIVFGILGNLGGSSAQKAKRKREREARQRRVREMLEEQRKGNDPFEEPAVTTATQNVEEVGEDVSERIREILGRAQGQPVEVRAQDFEPPTPRSTVPARGGETVGAGLGTQFEASLAKFDSAIPEELEVSDFEGFADQLSEMDDDASRKAKQARLAMEQAMHNRRPKGLPDGLIPRQVLLSYLLLSPPRAMRSIEDETLA